MIRSSYEPNSEVTGIGKKPLVIGDEWRPLTHSSALMVAEKLDSSGLNRPERDPQQEKQTSLKQALQQSASKHRCMGGRVGALC